ncbi:hypothetical protein [Nocardioides sp. Leaf285]|uniref:hypothetical protein n=1 Tax=Nocardioides sp. Leaf285 TaxID=1736322 RepID=UPI0009E81C2D|nr:hypothetical protein [Nocardioides sp. Leaf285]
MPLDRDELDHLLDRVQDRTVSRRQILALGGADHDIARLVRRHELVAVHPGAFVAHTGLPTWRQRAWCAVHARWPAALARESALPGPPADAPIQIAVDHRRTVRPLAGVVVHRTADLEGRVLWQATPPRVRREHAVIDVIAGEDPARHFGVLAAACHDRQTTPERVRAALDARGRVRGRGVIEAMLDDLTAGACSTLERAFWERVERPHGLPTGARQVRAGAGEVATVRDVEYLGLGVVVELDGRAFHADRAAWDADHQRDLEALVSGRSTVRLTWGQVTAAPCRTAGQLAALLRRAGWSGASRRCPRCPPGEAPPR